jgi:hypothetical protein
VALSGHRAPFEVQRVGPVDQHEGRLQQVVAVGATPHHVQEEVQLGRRRQVEQGSAHDAPSPGARARSPRRRGAHGGRAAFGDAGQRRPPAQLLEAIGLRRLAAPGQGRPASQSGRARRGSASPSASRDRLSRSS